MGEEVGKRGLDGGQGVADGGGALGTAQFVAFEVGQHIAVGLDDEAGGQFAEVDARAGGTMEEVGVRQTGSSEGVHSLLTQGGETPLVGTIFGHHAAVYGAELGAVNVLEQTQVLWCLLLEEFLCQ